MDAPTRLVQLEGLKIATPCPASWADMTGDDRTRDLIRATYASLEG